MRSSGRRIPYRPERIRLCVWARAWARTRLRVQSSGVGSSSGGGGGGAVPQLWWWCRRRHAAAHRCPWRYWSPSSPSSGARRPLYACPSNAKTAWGGTRERDAEMGPQRGCGRAAPVPGGKAGAASRRACFSGSSSKREKRPRLSLRGRHGRSSETLGREGRRERVFAREWNTGAR